MANDSIPIQSDLRPSYYDDFHCLAGDCRWNCCKHWRITFDKNDYLSLKHDKYSPELSVQMEHSIQRIRKNNPFSGYYAEIHLREDGSCPLQREDGLCALQVEKGPQALPQVCQTFPRKEMYSPSCYLERSLSPACEAVSVLLWDLPDGIDFRSGPLPKAQHKAMTFSPTAKMVPHFQEIRSVFIDYLQDRRFSLPSRIFMIGFAIQELMETADIPHWLAFAEALPEKNDINHLLKINTNENTMRMFITNNLKLLMKFQFSDQETRRIATDLLQLLSTHASDDGTQITIDSMPFLIAREKYAKIFADREYFMENLMVTLFFHLHLPTLNTTEDLWKSYMNFCNLYSFYRFLTIFSCREGISDEKAELFRLVVMASRSLLHNNVQQTRLRDELFDNDSTTLAHMAVLLSV